MRILLTGATGYIGKRLLPELLKKDHEVICVVRDKSRFIVPSGHESKIDVVEHDFLNPFPDNKSLNFDKAYYLLHSMSGNTRGFEDKEKTCAKNFTELADRANCEQIIYLSGLTNQEELSKHLESRKMVEYILQKAKAPLTTLKAGIIVGSGSASFEIIRDLVEKLPVMVAPKWINTRCQPIAIRNVIQYLTGVIEHDECKGNSYDIGGPEVLTYREMLLGYAKSRRLNRKIISVPIMTPRLSSRWLYFVTSTTYNLAVNLVDSMKVEVVCEENRIREVIQTDLLTYKESIDLAFSRIGQNLVASSWKDSFVAGNATYDLQDFVEVPQYGCFKDIKKKTAPDREKTINNVFAIGGNRGWYYGNLLWQLRGLLDKLVGGVGLRRGRTNQTRIDEGDVIDFWRVIVANRDKGRLLLYAEMKLPGEAWLEFNMEGEKLVQTATFRPRGIAGRLYWYTMLPFHAFIFRGMLRNLVEYKQ
jgi:uncharacterized protein YbjT (DUF2867 family)